MSKPLIAIIILVLAALACNWSEIAPQAAPVIESSPLPTFAISTLTPVPTETQLPIPTSTPEAPIAWPKDLGVNCRYGPGEEWEAVSSLPAETMAEIKGRTINTKWWYVSDPINPGEFCWVAYDVVDTAGNLNIVPIAEPPMAAVTAVTVDTLVSFTACSGLNPVELNGSISTNGPATVTYTWMVDNDIVVPAETIEFAKSGTKEFVFSDFSTGCGNYNVELRVTLPNEIMGKSTFTIESP